MDNKITEEWRKIPKYEEYEVSNLGRVKRLAYYKNVCSGSKQYCKEKILKPYNGAECVIFPSKDQRDWSKFTAPWYKKEKFDPKTKTLLIMK